MWSALGLRKFRRQRLACEQGRHLPECGTETVEKKGGSKRQAGQKGGNNNKKKQNWVYFYFIDVRFEVNIHTVELGSSSGVTSSWDRG